MPKKYRRADEKRREEQAIKNKADQQVYQAMRIASDARGLVSQPLIDSVNVAAAALTQAVNNYDMPAARSGMEELNTSLMALSKAYYEAKSAGGGSNGTAPAAPPPSPPAPGLAQSLGLASVPFDSAADEPVGRDDPDAADRMDLEELLTEHDK